MLEALARQSVFQLRASAYALATHKQVAESLDAAVARGPIGQLVLIAHAVADSTLGVCLHQGKSSWWDQNMGRPVR